MSEIFRLMKAATLPNGKKVVDILSAYEGLRGRPSGIRYYPDSVGRKGEIDRNKVDLELGLVAEKMADLSEFTLSAITKELNLRLANGESIPLLPSWR